jgi:hypothetical protein
MSTLGYAKRAGDKPGPVSGRNVNKAADWQSHSRPMRCNKKITVFGNPSRLGTMMDY